MSQGTKAQAPSPENLPRPNLQAHRAYHYFLDKSAHSEAEGDITSAIILARQAELVGLMIIRQRRLPEVSSAYARLMVSICLAARRLAVHSGNITQSHLSMVQNLDTLAGRLKLRLESEDKDQVGRAAIVEGLAVAEAATITNFLKAKSLYTPAKMLERTVAALTEILIHVRHLNLSVVAPFGTSTELLSLAGTAIANARHYLCWLWPSRLSDWDKANFMCHQAATLLSQHSTLEGTDVSNIAAALDQIYPLLKVSQKAIELRNYKQASWALRLAAKHLAAVARL